MHPFDKSGINYLKTYLIRGPGPQNRHVFPKDITTLILEYAQRDELIQLAKHLVNFLDSNFDRNRYKNLIFMITTAPKRKNLDFVLSSQEWAAQNMDEKVATLRNWTTQPIQGSFKAFFESYQAIIQFLASTPLKDSFDWSPLMYASCYAKPSVVNALLSKMNEVNSQDMLGWTPLMLASLRGREEIVIALLEKGANPNLVTLKAEDVSTERNASMERIDNELIEISCVTGSTALIIAAIKGHSQVVIALLNHGADPNSVNSWGCTPLILGARGEYSYPESEAHYIQRRKNETVIVKALLEKNAEINAFDRWGETALFKGVKDGNAEVVKALLEKKPNLEHQNYKGITVDYYAKLSDSAEVRALFNGEETGNKNCLVM